MFLFDSGQHNRLEKRLRLGQKSAGGWGGRRPLVTRFRKEHRLIGDKERVRLRERQGGRQESRGEWWWRSQERRETDNAGQGEDKRHREGQAGPGGGRRRQEGSRRRGALQGGGGHRTAQGSAGPRAGAATRLGSVRAARPKPAEQPARAGATAHPRPTCPAQSPSPLDPTHPRPPSPSGNVRTSGGRDLPQPSQWTPPKGPTNTCLRQLTTHTAHRCRRAGAGRGPGAGPGLRPAGGGELPGTPIQ